MAGDGHSRGRPIFLRTYALAVTLFALILPLAAPAQSLPVMSSLGYNFLYQHVMDPTLAQRWGSAYRFAGRLAIRLPAGTYVGFEVGSWQTVSDICIDGSCETDTHGSVSMAVAHQLFVQRYLVGTSVFARAGVGVGRTETLLSDGEFIHGEVQYRPLVSAGAGWDIALSRVLAVTPSVDYFRLFNVSIRRELQSALAVGVAVTVR